MTLKIAYDIKKPQLSRKTRSEVYLLLPLYINRSITKKFLIETILEMIDSSIKNPGESEYDIQNWLKRQKNQFLQKNSKWGLRPLATVHKSVHNKKFPIETLWKMMNSNVKNLGELEYDT